MLKLNANIALLAALLTSYVPSTAVAQPNKSGDWTWGGGDGTAWATTYSEKYGQEISLLIFFSASNKCTPSIMYAQTESSHSQRKPVGSFAGSFQVRVDSRNYWEVKSGSALAFYSKPNNNGTIDYVITLDAPVKFILELAYGQTFRVLRVDKGVTDRFSLAGSAAAIGGAFRICERQSAKATDPDMQYFNQGQYQQPAAPQRRQDPDLQYFR